MKKSKKSATVRITVHIPRTEASKLRHHATSPHQSLGQVVEEIVMQALGHSFLELLPGDKESLDSNNSL